MSFDLVDRFGMRYRDLGNDQWVDIPAARMDPNMSYSRSTLDRAAGPLREISRETPFGDDQ